MNVETPLRAHFQVLRAILTSLGFSEQTSPDRIRFEHAPTKTWFLYPPYRDDEDVSVGDLVAARHILATKGFLSREQFDRRLSESVRSDRPG